MKVNTVKVNKRGKHRFSVVVCIGGNLIDSKEWSLTVEPQVCSWSNAEQSYISCSEHFELRLSQYTVPKFDSASFRQHAKQVQAFYIWFNRFERIMEREQIKGMTLKRMKELAQEVL